MLNAFRKKQRARKLVLNGDYREALKLYNEISERYPKDLGVLENKFRILIMTGEHEEAISCLKKFITIKPNYNAYYQLASLLCSEKISPYEDSLMYYDQAIAMKKKFPEAYVGKGIALACLHKYDDAVQCYDAAIQMAPKDAYWAYCNKAIALLCQNKSLDQALELCDTALKSRKRTKEDLDFAYLCKSRLYGALHDIDKCQLNLSLAIDLNSMWKDRIHMFKELEILQWSDH